VRGRAARRLRVVKIPKSWAGRAHFAGAAPPAHESRITGRRGRLYRGLGPASCDRIKMQPSSWGPQALITQRALVGRDNGQITRFAVSDQSRLSFIAHSSLMSTLFNIHCMKNTRRWSIRHQASVPSNPRRELHRRTPSSPF
jgi:hypothetical protein